MQLYRHHTGLPADARGAVVAIGNFDGVHLGHQAVMDVARCHARELGARAGVLTFEPHPRSLFRPAEPSFRLTPFRPKVRAIARTGVDVCYVLTFDRAFAALDATGFIDEVLIDGLGVAGVVVGHDFVFGRGRAGSAEALAAALADRNLPVAVVPPVCGPDGSIHSSTRIRELLQSAQPALAAELLGRVWEVDGRVVPGDARGRTIGFPTANVDLGDYLRPAPGVYAVEVAIGGEALDGDPADWRPAVANLGWRPTFGGQDLVLEVHLLDFEGDLYGRMLRVALRAHLRSERKFDGLDSLKAQIALDCDRARTLLSAPPSSQGPNHE